MKLMNYNELPPEEKKRWVKILMEKVRHLQWLETLSKKEREEFQMEQAIKEFVKSKGNIVAIAKKFNVSAKKLANNLKEYLNEPVQHHPCRIDASPAAASSRNGSTGPDPESND